MENIEYDRFLLCISTVPYIFVELQTNIMIYKHHNFWDEEKSVICHRE